MIAIVGICYRKYIYYTLLSSCLPICVIAIVRLLSFLFLEDFGGNAKICCRYQIQFYSNQFHYLGY